MKGSDLFVKCLENEGVEYIFGVPGEETVDLTDSLSRSGIRFIVTRHEQSAAFMAEVYGRMTHRPGVCLATLGPGATNLTTGIADAHLDKAPLVAITGQSGLEKTHKESHQYIDIVTMFKQVTSWNSKVMRSDFIPEIIRKAFDIATDRPGAVHIELPEDIARENSSKQPLLRKIHPHITMHDEQDLKKAADMIRESAMPVILAGNGVFRGAAANELRRFVRSSGLPVITTFMGKGALPADDEQYLGSMGIKDRDHIMCGLEIADLVITVGYDYVEYSPRSWNPDGSKSIIHINSDHPETDESYIPDLMLLGDIRQALYKLNQQSGLKKEMPERFKSVRSRMVAELENYKDDISFPLKPQKIISDIRECMSRNDILVSDVGAHKLWAGRLFPAYEANTVFMSNSLAAMGFALPAAIVASFLKPEIKLVAVAGDGGFLMNLQELETAVRLGCSFVVVIFNDSKYGLIEWHERRQFDQSIGTEFTNPDFVKLAESFGAKGARIETAEEFRPQLREALDAGGVWILDVKVDYSENIKLTEALKNNICEI
ncbi:acetolactate synthase large subunit [Methanolobus halotolerans]|uniref:Acetolactate synthase large subunit n=1 Tax=Methanolobus halotolerans TaxID=2052935 RepID=A0A4E0QZ37_9EURY|nr:acetolactate synthase large subunit [Methanolobus halotolerans]TGC08984.1 acetolactate synthase large subunit [Methanolobus halotolerans]